MKRRDGFRTTSAVVLAIAGTTLAIACTETPTTVTTTVEIANLVVQPSYAELEPGQALAFQARAVTVAGDTVGTAVVWEATGGTINESGVFVSPGEDGTYSIIGTHPVRGWLTDTVEVDVREPAPPGPSVASVEITPGPVTVLPGDSIQYSAQAMDSAGTVLTDRTVSWSTSNPTVASVDSTGLVVAMAPGTTSIQAASEGRTAIVTVTVTTVSVASLSVDPATVSLREGATTLLTATPRDNAGNPLSSRQITWSTSDGSMATVSPTGLVTALSAGTATITATSEGASGSSLVTITAVPVASVSVIPSNAVVSVGNTVQLGALPEDAAGNPLGRPVTWSSKDAAIASVDNNGLVTGVAVGTVTITASSEGQSGTASITVAAVPVASVTLAPTSSSITEGQTLQLTATVEDPSGNALTGRVVTWSSQDGSIASVDGSGLVTGNAAGTVSITATSEGQSATATVIVTPAPVNSMVVTPATLTLTVGGTGQLGAQPLDAAGNPLAGRAVVWNSSNASIATVDGSGQVTAVAPGATNVTATSEGKSGFATITVMAVPVTSVSVSPGTASVLAGNTVQLTATPRDVSGNPLTGRTVTWASSDVSIATVSTSGLVSAAAVGTATIIATSEGQSGSSAITVTSVPVTSVSVAPSSASVQEGNTQQLTATPRDASGNPLTGRTVTWSSSAPSLATVSGSGLVTAINAGSVTMMATSEGQVGSAAITVTAAPGGVSQECQTPQTGWIWCDDFEVDRLSSYFEYDNAGGKFTRTAGAGVNGTTAMRSQFSAGTVSNGALHLAVGRTPQTYFAPVDAGTADYQELYWRMYVMNEAGWTGGGGFKLSRTFIFSSNTSWAQAMVAHVWSGASAPKENYLVIDPVSGTDANGNVVTTGYNDFANFQWLGSRQGVTPLFDSAHVGQWYCVEAHVVLNSPGQSNGIFELWIDDQPEASRINLNWLDTYSGYGLNAVYFENYWNTGSPAAQERYFDNIVVSTQRIGC